MVADNFLQKQQKQRGRPFAKGRSGNPAGRPRGSRNRSTLAAQMLLQGEAEALTRKAVELALGGDPTALRLCLDRLIAPHRERLVPLALPPMRKPADLAASMEAIAAAVARGLLAPAEAAELAKVVDTFAKAIEMRDFDARLRELEAQYSAASSPDPTAVFACYSPRSLSDG
jgi:hypothetical protein